MFLLYVDESGNPDGNQDRYFVFGGLAVFERKGYWLASEADAFEKEIFGSIDACEGQSIPGIPEWKWFASLNMDYPIGDGSLFSDLNWSWEQKRRSGWLPLTPKSTTFPESNYVVPGFSVTNLMVGYRSAGNWSRPYMPIIFWMTNTLVGAPRVASPIHILDITRAR